MSSLPMTRASLRSGRVREVAPQADPVTRTFQVKVGLTDPPEAMRLGATVIGTLADGGGADDRDSGLGPDQLQRPAGGLDRRSEHADSVDPQRRRACASIPATVTVSQGLDTGEIVVTAGVQALHPGQKVRLLGSEP